MAQAEFEIGGRQYALPCREGEQTRFESLARIVDAKARQAARGLGGINEARQLLLASLLLADEVNEARNGALPLPDEAADAAPGLVALAERLERLAARLEKDALTP